MARREWSGRGLSRRDLLRNGAIGLAAFGARPARAADTTKAGESAYVPQPPPTQYVLRVGSTTLNPDGKADVQGVTADGTYPGPLIRAKEGEVLQLRVENHLAKGPTSIHWHGLLVPAGMDGVPDVSAAPIASGRVFVYEFPVRQPGTYWYHSHVGFQEQVGFAGPIILEPREEPLHTDQDAIVMFSDWLHRSPDAVFAELRKGKPKPPAGGGGATMKPGGAMKPDLSDIKYDAFLLNGRGAESPWTLAVKPGERVRLRFVNAGSSTYFKVRLDGHPLQITHADGLAVEPVTVDHLLMGMAEGYDAVVTLEKPGSYTLHAVAQDGSGQAIGVLHTPDVAPAPNREMPSFDGRALAYGDLRAPAPTTLPRGDARPFELTLGGDMQRYVWTINGAAYPKADPLLIHAGDQVQLTMKNQTMMWHPMHLHGHFFRLLQGAGERCPLKHTVNVGPGETVKIEFTADNPGRWFFHCHNLYHLEGGMARVFEYVA